MKDSVHHFENLQPAEAYRAYQACQRFEAAWKAGQNPRIEDHLCATDDPVYHVLLNELIQLDVHYRCKAGESPLPADYAKRFPEEAGRPAVTTTDYRPEVNPGLIIAGRYTQNTSMNNGDQLPGFLDHWPEAQARGDKLSPENVCPDNAELLQVIDECETGEPGRVLTETLGDPHHTGIMPPAASPGSQPEVGGVFGDYRVAAWLGEGGMGRVFRATDPVLRREVALKVMKPEAAARRQARERFLREARAMAALQHDHVIPIFQVGEVDGVPFLAMPLLQGEPLADRLKRDKVLSPAEVLRLGREMAEGLAAAHAKGLIHRDVKPDNIWLEAGTDRVKLLDFGLARDPDPADGVTAERSLVGTPAFMSPEQASGLPLTHSTDLFSLGSVLYECATGQRAFQGKTLTAILLAVTLDHPPAAHEVNPSVPANVSDLIQRLHVKEPEERPASAMTVCEMIRAIEAGAVDIAGTETGSLSSDMRRLKASRRWWWLTAAAAVLLLVGWVGYQRLNPLPGANPPITPPTVDLPKPAPPALTAKLDIRVWKRDDTTKGLDLAAAGALPLRAGDWMRIEVDANRAAYLYLLYLDAKGAASPRFPWRNYDWNDRPEEEKRSHLDLPEDLLKDGQRLTAGPSGIEAVLLLARDAPLSAEQVARLQDRFAEAPPQGEFDPLRGAVWLGKEVRFGHKEDRGRPDCYKSGTVIDPVERMRRLVRRELKELGGDVRAVCYPFQGK